MYSLKRILDRFVNLPIIVMGFAIVKLPFFNKYKLHLLSTWRNYKKRSKLDDFLFRCFFEVWVRLEYLKEPNPDKREKLKSLAMGGEGGKCWAESYQKKSLPPEGRTGRLSFREACPIYDEISTILMNTDSNYLVIQVGSSSGNELAYFANMFPHHEFVGADIYDEVVEYSGRCHQSPNLLFVKSSAKEIGNLLNEYSVNSKGRKVLVYSSSSLTYVQPEHIINFFNSISKHENLKVMIEEPANEAQGKVDELKRSIWRGNFSYTHDYKWYAEKAGIETEKCLIVRPYCSNTDIPAHRNTVHYFFYGQTR